MPPFPSREWVAALVVALGEDPEASDAGEGWVGDFGGVVEAEPGKLERPFVVHLVTESGKVVRFSVLREADELDELEPAYRAAARYSVWKGLLRGEVDPVEAVLRRELKIVGDLAPIIARLKYKGLADRVMAKVPTVFPDENGG